MFQEIAHNGPHRDILADSRDAGLQTADPPNDQFDLYTGATGLIQRSNHIPVAQGVHFRDNMGPLARPGVIRLSVNQMQEPVFEPQGGQGQLVPAQRLRIAAEHIEYGCGILADHLTAGQQAHIRVQFGGGVIIIAGAQMHIPPNAVLLPAHHQCNLAVSFQSHQAVDYMASRLFQHLGPNNIIFLVKTGFQFHQHRDLLAVFRGLGQRRYDGGMAADPVQSLLDCQHLGIPGRLVNKFHHRRKSLVGMVQQHIPFPDPGKNIAAGRKLRHRLRFIPGGFQLFEAFQTIHFHQKGQIQGTVNEIQILFPHVKFLADNLQQPLVNIALHLQADYLAPLPLF